MFLLYVHGHAHAFALIKTSDVIYLQVMFSTDGYAFPETFYLGLLKWISIYHCITLDHDDFSLQRCLCALAHTYLWLTGAKKAREVVLSVLSDACADGDLSIPEAIEAAKDIFSQNAVQFYKIDRAVKSSGSANSVCSNFAKVKSNDSENHVSLVRVFWADASGQQRCRVSSFNFQFLC